MDSLSSIFEVLLDLLTIIFSYFANDRVLIIDLLRNNVPQVTEGFKHMAEEVCFQ
jgi:hypothetical protein